MFSCFGQCFRGDIQHFGMPVQEVFVNFTDLFLIKGGVKEMRHTVLAAVASDEVNLVFHQGDQGTDDDRHAFADDGGQLVAKAFAAAGRHDDESIFTGQYGFDDRILALFETVEAKLFLQMVRVMLDLLVRGLQFS